MKSIYKKVSLSQIKKIGEELIHTLVGGEILCFYGELGAGKTTFIQGMVTHFIPGKRVLSPTFIIVRHYNITYKKVRRFYHMDLYRITEKDVPLLGISELFGASDTILAIEWADRLGKFLPDKRIDITIEKSDTDTRNIEIWNRT